MSPDRERPFIQGPTTRLQQRERDARQHDECRERAAYWKRRDGQLVPDPIGRRCERHECRNLPCGETQEQRVLDVQMIRNFVCARHAASSSRTERRVHGGHDLGREEHGHEAEHTGDHACLAELLAT